MSLQVAEEHVLELFGSMNRKQRNRVINAIKNINLGQTKTVHECVEMLQLIEAFETLSTEIAKVNCSES